MLCIPKDYTFPQTLANKGKDWKMCWYLCQELGVASVPGSGKSNLFDGYYPVQLCLIADLNRLAFFTEKNSHLGENFLRFIVCKTDEQLNLAKGRLRGLGKLLPPQRDSGL